MAQDRRERYSSERDSSEQGRACMISDGVLVEQTSNGGLGPFDQLYQRHAPAAWRTAMAITSNTHDAADAVAEAFARVLRSVPAGQLDDSTCFRPYLLTATRNAALDILRRGARTRPTGDMRTLDRPVTARGPSEQVVASEDAAMVATAFAALPERWRTVLWLTEVEGVTPSDAASVLHTSPNAVAQLGVRARAGLRQQFLQAHVRSDSADGCRSTIKALGSYATGSLSAKATARVDRHVANCPACAERLDELNDLATSLRRVAVPAIPASLAAWAAARAKVVPGAGPTGLGPAGLGTSGHPGLGGSGQVGAAASGHGILRALPIMSAKPLAGAALGIIGVGVIGASVMGQSFAPLPQPALPSSNLASGGPAGIVRHIGLVGSSSSSRPRHSTATPASGSGQPASASSSSTVPEPGPVAASNGSTANQASGGPVASPGSAASGGGDGAVATPGARVAATGQPGNTSPQQSTPSSGASDPTPGGSGSSPPTTSPPASASPTPLVQVSANLAVGSAPVSASVGVGPGSCTGVGLGAVHVGCTQPTASQPSLSVSGSLVGLLP